MYTQDIHRALINTCSTLTLSLRSVLLLVLDLSPLLFGHAAEYNSELRI